MGLNNSSLVHHGLTTYRMIEKIEERMEDIGELELEACDSPSWISNLFGNTSGPVIKLSENG